MDLNCVEKSVKDRIEKHYNKSRIPTIGRTANLTVPHKGRGSCHRDLCSRSPFGAYFSTQSSTLPAAMATKRLTVRPYSIVNHIIYDKDTKKSKRSYGYRCGD
jgi:choline dehydrogenase-like flavoprotein